MSETTSFCSRSCAASRRLLAFSFSSSRRCPSPRGRHHLRSLRPRQADEGGGQRRKHLHVPNLLLQHRRLLARPAPARCGQPLPLCPDPLALVRFRAARAWVLSAAAICSSFFIRVSSASSSSLRAISFRFCSRAHPLPQTRPPAIAPTLSLTDACWQARGARGEGGCKGVAMAALLQPHAAQRQALLVLRRLLQRGAAVPSSTPAQAHAHA
jgi:hypothetical protein